MKHKPRKNSKRWAAQQLATAKVSRKGEAVLDGTRPTPGLWLVNLTRQRCYGRVLRVNRRGEVVTMTERASHHAGQMLHDTGCTYATEIPTGGGWAYFVDLHWTTDTPPESWGALPGKKEDAA